jgi:hypothetical protein
MFTDWLRNWLRYREQACNSTSVDGVMYEASEYSKQSLYKLTPFPRVPPRPQFALEYHAPRGPIVSLAWWSVHAVLSKLRKRRTTRHPICSRDSTLTTSPHSPKCPAIKPPPSALDFSILLL